MRQTIVLLFALALTGCGAPKISGNAQGGVMGSVSEDRGFRAAQAHCQHYGRDARITQIVPYAGGSMSFVCV